MRISHSLDPLHLDLLRSFFLITEHGSLSKAAAQLRVSQSTLTRQMHSLEADLGGKLLERGPSGVSLTAAGIALRDDMRPVLARFDSVLAEARKLARGQSANLRIGYIASAAPKYLHPALSAVRKSHPELKIKLIDLSPGEQIEALRAGTIDIALTGNISSLLAREFYVRRLALVPVVVALSEQHPHAGETAIALADLRTTAFIGAPERDLPGQNQWLTQLCRKAGFRPRFLEESDSLAHALSTVVAENAAIIVPAFSQSGTVPGVVFRPLKSPSVQWELLVAWQRGRLGEGVRALLDALPAQPTKGKPA